MLKKLREDNLSEDGFTLTELLVVILIIGILSAIAVPVFLNQRNKANESSLKSDLKNAATVMETELAANKGIYPSTLPESAKISQGISLDLKNDSLGLDQSGYVNEQNKIRLNIKSIKEGIPDTYLYLGVSSNGVMSFENLAPQLVDGTNIYLSFKATCSAGNALSYGFEVKLFSTKRLWSGVSGQMCNSGGVVSSVNMFATTEDKAKGMTYIVSETVVLPVGATYKPKLEGQGFCIDGFHQNEKDNIWKYDSLNGGLSKGECLA